MKKNKITLTQTQMGFSALSYRSGWQGRWDAFRYAVGLDYELRTVRLPYFFSVTCDRDVVLNIMGSRIQCGPQISRTIEHGYPPTEHIPTSSIEDDYTDFDDGDLDFEGE